MNCMIKIHTMHAYNLNLISQIFQQSNDPKYISKSALLAQFARIYSSKVADAITQLKSNQIFMGNFKTLIEPI